MTRLKWAAKALNELKRALMSSNFNKILPVMHVSVRYDTGYNFSTSIINAENKEGKKHFCCPFS